jgi:anthranilate phosphoribosyltransferase
MMQIQEAIGWVIEGRDLSGEDMRSVMHQVMGGEATPAQIGGFLVGLRMKGETIEEIAAAVQVMRELATAVVVQADHLVDTCGTGGDGADLFNVSTAASFVVAAAGGSVAKHGNRSVSSSCGSSDVLAFLGVPLDLSPQQVARCVEEVGMGFMFAPGHHSAMKHAIGPRRELAQRTIFNVLGPMTNPAGVRRQVIGVFDQALCRPMAEVLKRLGSEHVMVLHASDGLDEITLNGSTHVAELRDGSISEYQLEPGDFGMESCDLDGLAVSTAEQSVNLIRAALGAGTEKSALKARNIIALNAGAAIYVAGVAATLADGVQMAEDAIGSGAALQKIDEFVQFSQLAGGVVS